MVGDSASFVRMDGHILEPQHLITDNSEEGTCMLSKLQTGPNYQDVYQVKYKIR